PGTGDDAMTRQILPLIAALALAVAAVGVVTIKAEAAPTSATRDVDRPGASTAPAAPPHGPAGLGEISRNLRPHGVTGRPNGITLE
ncbi:MAG: hypothetical protein ACRDOX_07290, partial [Nocardioides sp.]